MLKKFYYLLLTVVLIFFIATLNLSAQDNKLSGYGADIMHTSVSGLSSGAFMTSQFEVVFSKNIVGAGIIAGGPYYCSGSFDTSSHEDNAMSTCMNPVGLGPNTKKLVEKAKDYAKKGLIDDLNNLKDDKIYIFSGTNDQTVTTKVVDETRKFFKLDRKSVV